MENLTKNYILDSFNSLLMDYPLEKITVEMIIKKCGIAKSTFYRWFLDKYDVMNYNYKKLVDDLFATSNCHNWKDVYRHLVVRSRINAKRIANAYSYLGTNCYSSFLYDYSYSTVVEKATLFRGENLSKSELLQLSLFCYGVVWITYDWVLGKLQMTDEQLTDELFNAMPNSVKFEWSEEALQVVDK